MEEIFIKKYWSEEETLFYIHFQNNKAVRQIEIADGYELILTSEEPIIGNSMLYDQSLEELNLEESDFITEREFNKVWNELSNKESSM